MLSTFNIEKYNPNLTAIDNSKNMGIPLPTVYRYINKLKLKRTKCDRKDILKYKPDLWDSTKTSRELSIIYNVKYQTIRSWAKRYKLKCVELRKNNSKKKQDKQEIEEKYIPKHRETMFVGGYDGYSVTANEGEIL